jgi:hypothetical protein
LFEGKYQLVQEEKKRVKIPTGELNDQAIQALADLEQKLVLKAYSTSTVKNYCSAIVPYYCFIKAEILKS